MSLAALFHVHRLRKKEESVHYISRDNLIVVTSVETAAVAVVILSALVIAVADNVTAVLLF